MDDIQKEENVGVSRLYEYLTERWDKAWGDLYEYDDDDG